MTKIPPDDILEGLYKLRIRESDKLKTVSELYDLETHQKKLGPDYHRLKAMVTRSIEQEIRNKNFGARNGNYERNAVVKNQGTKQRVLRILGDSCQKPQKREPVDMPRIMPMNERKWIDIEPSEPSLAAYEVSKKVISLLRHNQTVQREEDGAIQFWRIKFHLRNQFSQIQHWSDERWKACLATGGGSKKDISIALIIWETIFYFRALQGHSGSNLIDPLLQDNVINHRGLFQHIYHSGCAFNLHSIINNGLIPGGQDSNKRQNSVLLAY